VIEIVDRELATKRFTSECTAAYLATIRGFTTDQIAQKMSEVRTTRGMFDALEREVDWYEDTDLTMGASGTHIMYKCRLSFTDESLV
jgi:DNA-directed RNA polymerase III subunit RPC1